MVEAFQFWLFWMGIALAAFGGFGFGYGRWRYKKAAELHACTKVPPENDARESAKKIGSFLRKRSWVCDMRHCSNGSVAGYNTFLAESIFDGHEQTVMQFIRLCHALGCEVVVRQVNSECADIEADTDAEVRSRMRKEWYAAYKRYDGYIGSVSYHYDFKRGETKPFWKFYPEDGLLEKLAEERPDLFKSEYP